MERPKELVREPGMSLGFPWGLPGLVNVHKKLWNIHPLFMGKSTISMGIFNSFLYVYQRVMNIDLDLKGLNGIEWVDLMVTLW